MFKYLYHGTDHDFNEFSNEYLSTNDSIDQYGSGFYFYGKKMKHRTFYHGSIQMKVKAWIEKSIEHDSELKYTEDQIYSYICSCEDLENRLWDFGDIETDGFDKVLDYAVSLYMEDHWLDCLNKIGNDFFPGSSVKLLLNKFVKETGINCITDSERDIFVILRKSDLEII